MNKIGVSANPASVTQPHLGVHRRSRLDPNPLCAQEAAVVNAERSPSSRAAPVLMRDPDARDVPGSIRGTIARERARLAAGAGSFAASASGCADEKPVVSEPGCRRVSHPRSQCTRAIGRACAAASRLGPLCSRPGSHAPRLVTCTRSHAQVCSRSRRCGRIGRCGTSVT